MDLGWPQLWKSGSMSVKLQRSLKRSKINSDELALTGKACSEQRYSADRRNYQFLKIIVAR